MFQFPRHKISSLIGQHQRQIINHQNCGITDTQCHLNRFFRGILKSTGHKSQNCGIELAQLQHQFQRKTLDLGLNRSGHSLSLCLKLGLFLLVLNITCQTLRPLGYILSRQQ